MTNTTMKPKRIVPEAFNEYRQKMFARTVRLTEQAIAKLEAKHQPLTLDGLCEATRELDEQGKGLRPAAILRNPQAAELFRQHSPVYQARQHKARKAKRKRPRARTASATPAIYLGLRTPDLIQMVEDVKAQIAGLNAQQEKLEAERKEAYRLRDEALQQNTRLLATLTSRAELPGRK
jgi:septal ring factor EnvC (AmiA/AmiB activator)